MCSSAAVVLLSCPVKIFVDLVLGAPDDTGEKIKRDVDTLQEFRTQRMKEIRERELREQKERVAGGERKVGEMEKILRRKFVGGGGGGRRDDNDDNGTGNDNNYDYDYEGKRRFKVRSFDTVVSVRRQGARGGGRGGGERMKGPRNVNHTSSHESLPNISPEERSGGGGVASGRTYNRSSRVRSSSFTGTGTSQRTADTVGGDALGGRRRKKFNELGGGKGAFVGRGGEGRGGGGGGPRRRRSIDKLADIVGKKDTGGSGVGDNDIIDLGLQALRDLNNSFS